MSEHSSQPAYHDYSHATYVYMGVIDIIVLNSAQSKQSTIKKNSCCCCATIERYSSTFPGLTGPDAIDDFAKRFVNKGHVTEETDAVRDSITHFINECKNLNCS